MVFATFLDEEAETQRSYATCPQFPSDSDVAWAWRGLTRICLSPKAMAFYLDHTAFSFRDIMELKGHFIARVLAKFMPRLSQLRDLKQFQRIKVNSIEFRTNLFPFSRGRKVSAVTIPTIRPDHFQRATPHHVLTEFLNS